MNILVACEESQRVTIELRELGHEAYSCDILDPSGGRPEWHIQQDVIPLLNGKCSFHTMDGVSHSINGKWDLIIAFPPCTHLAVSGAMHFEKKRKDGRQREGIEFFCKILSCDCEKIAVENPVGIMGGGNYLKQYFPEIAEKYNLPKEPTQTIQPYEYGEPSKKKTCLWLKGLDPLNPTNIVEPKLITYTCKNGKTATFSEDYCIGGGDRARRRSKTYLGVAKAMAQQWAGQAENQQGRALKVLSLFDGISCGKVALERAGIQVEEYVAFEIDKSAIKISKKNHPEIIQRGDVTKADFTEFKGFDLVMGGSPCQGFSIAGKQLNFNDPRSKLFFEFKRAIKEVNPKYFLLENVKMKKEYENIISEYLGVEPIEIDSNLVSAQNRKRLYWTNIPGVTQPEDRGIMLLDIVHEKRPEDNVDLTPYKVPFDKTLKIIEKEVQEGKIGYFKYDAQANRVYSIHGKSVTLLGEAGGAAKMGQYLFGCITPDRVDKRQRGQRFNEGDKFYTLTAQDRHGVFIDGYIRKLTPVECERLQTLPDEYTAGVSDAQRYKVLGNGWTVEVITHILKSLQDTEKIKERGNP